MKGQCRFCGIKLKDESNIRCDKCDMAWQDGRAHGIVEIKSKLREISHAFFNLLKENHD